MNCPLCLSTSITHYHQDRRRDYHQCQTCDLVFVPPAQRLNAAQEKAEYDLHQNHLDDEGYQRFLQRVISPIQRDLPPSSRGLDFGSGPTPVLMTMLSRLGYVMQGYDRFYADNPEVLTNDYDFIVSTEVVEHLFQPGVIFTQLLDCLKPGGHLYIMTKRVINKQRFAQWHYKNDPTHVCFFSRTTFEWLAYTHQLDWQEEDTDVVSFTKPITHQEQDHYE